MNLPYIRELKFDFNIKNDSECFFKQNWKSVFPFGKIKVGAKQHFQGGIFKALF